MRRPAPLQTAYVLTLPCKGRREGRSRRETGHLRVPATSKSDTQRSGAPRRALAPAARLDLAGWISGTPVLEPMRFVFAPVALHTSDSRFVCAPFTPRARPPPPFGPTPSSESPFPRPGPSDAGLREEGPPTASSWSSSWGNRPVPVASGRIVCIRARETAATRRATGTPHLDPPSGGRKRPLQSPVLPASHRSPGFSLKKRAISSTYSTGLSHQITCPAPSIKTYRACGIRSTYSYVAA